MTSNRPYLIRALYDWLVDNEQTPYLLVDAGREGVQVPTDYIEEGRIVLNVSPSAVRSISLANDLISFNARFGGKAYDIFVPPDAVLGVYSREDGQGMLFPEDGPDAEPPEPTDPEPEKRRPALKLVK